MKVSERIRYWIEFNPERIVSKQGPNGETKFSFPATSTEPKLYIISNGGAPFYVGATKRPIGERLRTGFQADGRNGYSGYLWRHYMSRAALDIWPLELEEADFIAMGADPSAKRVESDQGKLKNILVEALEAEVVLLIRQMFDRWPKYQSEIHFHQSLSTHTEVAVKILGHYRTPQGPTAD